VRNQDDIDRAFPWMKRTRERRALAREMDSILGDNPAPLRTFVKQCLICKMSFIVPVDDNYVCGPCRQLP
jgi:hypothetical protein